MGLVQF